MKLTGWQFVMALLVVCAFLIAVHVVAGPETFATVSFWAFVGGVVFQHFQRKES